MEEMVCRINSLERGNHDLQNDLNVSHRRYNALKGQMNEAKRVNKRQTLNINELLHRNAEVCYYYYYFIFRFNFFLLLIRRNFNILKFSELVLVAHNAYRERC